MMIYDPAAGCWRAVSPVTVARWTAWRLAHPGWHAPVRTALEAIIACGKPAALAAALMGNPVGSQTDLGDAAAASRGEQVSEYARGGFPARVPSSPPGGSRAVGGTFVGPPGFVSPMGPQPAVALSAPAEPPQEVPEPGSLALLGAGVVLAALSRRSGRGSRGRGVRSPGLGPLDRFGGRIYRIAKLALPAG